MNPLFAMALFSTDERRICENSVFDGCERVDNRVASVVGTTSLPTDTTLLWSLIAARSADNLVVVSTSFLSAIVLVSLLSLLFTIGFCVLIWPASAVIPISPVSKL